MKQSENCKQPSSTPPPFSRRMNILYIDNRSNAYDMVIPRYIAILALMPKSALNKSWRYIERALYMSLMAIEKWGYFSMPQLKWTRNIRL